MWVFLIWHSEIDIKTKCTVMTKPRPEWQHADFFHKIKAGIYIDCVYFFVYDIGNDRTIGSGTRIRLRTVAAPGSREGLTVLGRLRRLKAGSTLLIQVVHSYTLSVHRRRRKVWRA